MMLLFGVLAFGAILAAGLFIEGAFRYRAPFGYVAGAFFAVIAWLCVVGIMAS